MKQLSKKWKITLGILGAATIAAGTAVATVACGAPKKDTNNVAQNLASKLVSAASMTVNGQTVAAPVILTGVSGITLSANENLSTLTTEQQSTINTAFQDWLNKSGAPQNTDFHDIFSSSSGVSTIDVTIDFASATVVANTVSGDGVSGSTYWLEAPINVVQNNQTYTSTTTLKFAGFGGSTVGGATVYQTALDGLEAALAVEPISLSGVSSIKITTATTATSLSSSDQATINQELASYLQSNSAAKAILTTLNASDFSIDFSTATFANGSIKGELMLKVDGQTYTPTSLSHSLPVSQITFNGFDS